MRPAAAPNLPGPTGTATALGGDCCRWGSLRCVTVAERKERRKRRFDVLGWPDPDRCRRPRACQRCGRPIVQAATGRPRLYCRQACRQRAYERRRLDRAVGAVAEERDAARWRLGLLERELGRLAAELAPFAHSAPDAGPPDPAGLAIAVVELAEPGWLLSRYGTLQRIRRRTWRGPRQVRPDCTEPPIVADCRP